MILSLIPGNSLFFGSLGAGQEDADTTCLHCEFGQDYKLAHSDTPHPCLRNLFEVIVRLKVEILSIYRWLMLVSCPGHREYEGYLSTNIEHQNRCRAPLLLNNQEVYNV